MQTSFVSFVYNIDAAGEHRPFKAESSIWLKGNEVRWRNGAELSFKMCVLVQAWSLGLDLEVE